ncbi:MAG TPA: hypothetical protein PK441_11225 [Burkholderiaceae bacterium]|nr:hypothetical protein [Burkholderiaceae bacterium]
MADLRAALAQPAAPDAPLVAGQVIAGAVYDLMGYLTTLDKSISLGSSELATPASDALSDWAMTRGLSLDEPDIANWHTHIAAPDVQPVARVLVWKGPRHINTPPPAARTYAEFPEQSAGPHNPDAYWHNSTPLYAAAQAAQPAPIEFEETDPDNCEHYCPHCGGSGEVEEADSAGPDARMVPVSCQHCDGHGTLIAAYRGAVNLLLAEQRKYLNACADWYHLKHAAQPAPQPLTEAAPTRADLVAALTFYADGQHFDKADPDAWDTVSGEPQNWWCDEAGTATVEGGSIAEMALAGKLTAAQIEAMGDDGITAAPTTDKGQG